MRQRIEDLGRIYEKVLLIEDLHVWDIFPKGACRNTEWFFALNLQEQKAIIDRIQCDHAKVLDLLVECRLICEAKDELNRME